MKIRYKDLKMILEEEKEINDDILVNKRFTDVVFDKNIVGVSFDNCEFVNCIFKCPIKRSTFLNCKFYKCEMSNIIIERIGFHSCLFDNNHAVGTNYIDNMFKNTIFSNSHMKLSIFSGSTFKSVDIVETNISQSNISSCSFESEVVFDQCDAIELEVLGSSLSGVDVSTSKIEGLVISPEGVKGLIVTEVQAIDLISLLGVVIK